MIEPRIGPDRHILTADMSVRSALLTDTTEDCEAARWGEWHFFRCSRKAKYAATGPVTLGYRLGSSPVETRFLCTQHSRKHYVRVIVRKETPA